MLPLYPSAELVLDPYHVVQQVAETAAKLWPGKKNKAKVKKLVERARAALGMRKRRSRTKYRTGPNKIRYKRKKSGLDGSGSRLLDEVLRPLQGTVRRGKKRLRQLIAYVERNLYRLDLGALRKRGFQIGSGAMESLHRTGSQVRLKRAGCHWTAEASQAILNLRMLTLSGRWDEFWPHAADTHLPNLKRVA